MDSTEGFFAGAAAAAAGRAQRVSVKRKESFFINELSVVSCQFSVRTVASSSRRTDNCQLITEDFSLQIHPHALHFRVLLQRVMPSLPAEARLFVPAEGQARVVEVVGVDPDGPGLQCLRGAQR